MARARAFLKTDVAKPCVAACALDTRLRNRHEAEGFWRISARGRALRPIFGKGFSRRSALKGAL
eukprot:2097526-Pyramimonas_sp.AAC.1